MVPPPRSNGTTIRSSVRGLSNSPKLKLRDPEEIEDIDEDEELLPSLAWNNHHIMEAETTFQDNAVLLVDSEDDTEFVEALEEPPDLQEVDDSNDESDNNTDEEFFDTTEGSEAVHCTKCYEDQIPAKLEAILCSDVGQICRPTATPRCQKRDGVPDIENCSVISLHC
ncbi:hypothetical protein B0H17DRAFT_1147333 [Mycena rosella]|uniref:Uncharacterized protein n=1 Tax=Mycena rosella TaxID=1033263 RepID=A0AAD7G3F4_MYCRO|nr:hypothetical protein B0H17DRAFT_1147333 [Mycena rosella]